MKFKIDDKQVFELTETQKKVIKNDIYDELFDEDIEHRVRCIIYSKYKNCFKRLKDEWEQKLAQRGVKMIPTDSDEFAQLVFSQEDYKSRSQREPIESSKLRDRIKDKEK